MRSTRFIGSVLLGALLALGACKDKQEEAVSARETAAKKETEAREARREAEAKEEESERETEKQFAKDRADLRERLRKDVDAAERKIAHLREKMTDLKGAARKNAEAASHEVDLRKARVEAAFDRVDNAVASQYEAAKIQLESDLAALNKAVDGFDNTID
jgi:hypothetical protein